MRHQNGFTLVEVMLSAAIGLLVISSIGVVLKNGILMSTDDRSQIYASNALKEEVETLRRTSFDTLVAYGATSTFTNAQIVKLTGGAGTRSVAAGLGSDMKKVTLTVQWTSRNGRTISEKLTTYISRAGVNGT
jgi:prepilin-type N-terminal cleavage/methylation domain-containing protein